MEDSDTHISLLYVDDETILLEASKQYLERCGDFTVTTTPSAKEALDWIQGQEYDAVVSDYQMPEMDGLEFLRTLRAQGNNIPFIIFTGKGREDVVIDALNAGADFYLQKGGKPKSQFAELSHKIRHAVRVRKSEKIIEEINTNLNGLIEAIPDIVYFKDAQGRYILVNQTFEKFAGLKRESIIGKTNRELLPPDLAERCDISDREVIEKHGPVRTFETMCDEQGETIYFETTKFPLYNKNGVLRGIIGTRHDITGLKRAEEKLIASEQFQKAILASSPVGMGLVRDRVMDWANDTMYNMLGYAPEELHGRSSEILYPDDREFRRAGQLLYETGEAETEFVRKDGTVFPCFIRVSPLNPASVEDGFIVVVVDITEQKQVEMQMATQRDLAVGLTELSSPEEIFPLCIETAMHVSGMDAGGIYLVEPGTRDLVLQYGTGVPDSFKQVFFRFPADLKITRRILSGEHTHSTKNKFRHGFHDTIQKEKLTCVCTLPVYFREEVIGCIYLASHTLDELSPKYISALETITAQIGNGIGRVLAETEIEKLNQKLADIIEFLPDATFVIDIESRVIAWNRAIEQMTGISKEDMIGKGDYEYGAAFYGESRPILIDLVLTENPDIESSYEFLRTGANTRYSEIYCPYVFGGKGAYISGMASAFYDTEGNVTGAIESLRDITELRESKQKLKEAHQQFETVMDNLDAIIYVADMETSEILFINKMMREAFGDITGQKCWKGLMRSDEGPCHFCTNEQLVAPDGTPTDCQIWEHYNPIMDTWVECHGRVIPWTDGRLVRLEMAFDIGQRKKMETQLAESKERYRTLVESNPDAVVTLDLQGRVLFINRGAVRLSQMREEEVLGRILFDLFPPEEARLGREKFETIIKTKQPERYESRLTHAGQEFYHDSVGVPVLSDDGEVTSVMVISHDITLQKEAEKIIRESEQKYREFFMASVDTAFGSRPEQALQPEHLLLIEDNPADAKLIEMMLASIPDISYSLEKCTRLSEGLELIAGGDIDLVLLDLGLPDSEGNDTLIKLVTEAPDLPVVVVTGLDEEEVAIGTLKSGAQDYLVKGHIDGSALQRSVRYAFERKVAEGTLRDSEQKYRMLFNFAPAGVLVTDFSGKVLALNPAMQQMTGYSLADFDTNEGITAIYADPDERKNVLKILKESGRVRDLELRQKRKDGSLFTTLLNIDLIKTPVGNLLLTITRDITQEKATEEALRESESRFRDLAQLLPQTVFELDLQNNVTFVNSSGLKTFGYTEDDSDHDINCLEILIPEDRDRASAMSDDILKGKRDVSPGNAYTALRKDGTTFPVVIHSGKIIREGEIVGIRGIVVDVTEIKRNEDALKKANKKLNLLSSITRHDILNQITALSAYLFLIDQQLPEDSAIREDLPILEEITETIQEQISFTSDYDDLGVMAPKWQSVRAVAEQSATTFGHHGLLPEITTGALEVFADPMLEKVFYNFFENAVRHGGDDMNQITVSSQTAEDGTCILTIEDNGVGVSREMKERIFDRGIGSNTGLGLFLVKEILDITGIKIRECGTPGSGAKFEMIIPDGGFRREGE